MSFHSLSQICNPTDLDSLSIQELKLVAEQIRSMIIDVLSKTGGHLGSNLGIVELTVALHKVFDSPEDQFIFDVSHQTYPHKILTGRQSKFSEIRQHKGLCGFSHPKESPHDHFFAGHAGTALSLALGVAKSRDLNSLQHHVIPILGDASLTCGLTLEALNNIPKDLSNFIVVLNDNNMSISQNVGAITHILSRLLSNPTSMKIAQEIKTTLAKIPNIGPFLAKQGHKITESVKNLVSTAPFFEQFGLSYIGPIDGHDIEKLIDVFTALKHSSKPVILHLLTTKGKGMATAIDNPTPYHGCKPFDKLTGLFHQIVSAATFPQIFGKHILELGKQDPSLVVVTPAMASGSCLDKFFEMFPNRSFDVGIAEGHCVTFSGGLAFSKKHHVICSVYATFLQRAFDNLFHDVCLQNLPVLFAIDRAGISGPDGSTHHGIYDLSFLQTMPNLVIAQPRDGLVLKELLNSAFSWNLPVAIRYPNMATEALESHKTRDCGKAEILLEEGFDFVFIALGIMNFTALEVAKNLKEHGILSTVIDPVFIKPLDYGTICQRLKTTTHLVILEEHSIHGGLGSALFHLIHKEKLNNLSIHHFGIPDLFVEHGSYKHLIHELGLSSEAITSSLLSKLEIHA